MTMHRTQSPLRKRSARRRLAAVAATASLVLAAPAAVAPAALADAQFPSTEGKTSAASLMTYDSMIAELEKIEATSKHGVDVFTLAEVGTEFAVSEQGRDLYVATVGDGPEDVWLQGRIHGNEPYGGESLMALLKKLGSNNSAAYQQLREAYTFHIIPMYNPDGSEENIRHTILQDGSEERIDLNRDWMEGKFYAVESEAFYEYWTMVDPDFGVDIHHQGLKNEYGTEDAVTLSLGISLAPGGPTLPALADGEYDVLTRQMNVHVFDKLSKYGSINIDRYQVGGSYEIDIHGGVVSAMMLGLDHRGLNAEGHSNPMVFFETSGNSSDGSLGQKARGKSIQQNVRGLEALLTGMASGEVQQEDPERWEEIPHAPTTGYFTDDGIVPVD
ncbi:hypothetical protein GCM10027591_04510 [Zhihengliuella somnathii]